MKVSRMTVQLVLASFSFLSLCSFWFFQAIHVCSENVGVRHLKAIDVFCIDHCANLLLANGGTNKTQFGRV